MEIYIFLRASTFNSSKLIKKLGDKNFVYIALLWGTNKAQRFIFLKTKWGKPQIITKSIPFFEGNPAEHQYLSVLTCECKHA